MDHDIWNGLKVAMVGGVATVTLDHPPLNLMDGVLTSSLWGLVHRMRDDADVRVIVFDSADPDFFCAHGSTAYLTDPDALPAASRAALEASPDAVIPDGLNVLQALIAEMRNLPQVTIGKIRGLARGAGNEFLMSLDMRFAAIGESGQAQPEAHLAILPAGGGTVTMPGLLGRARALELIIGGQLIGAELAERYGLVNRALPAAELDSFVDALAQRMSRVRPEVVAAIKATVSAVAPPVPLQAYAIENAALESLFTPDLVEQAHRQLAAGLETRAGELDLEGLLDSMWPDVTVPDSRR
jgi:enoyl-CoA hydratase/carnithine racemase